MTTSKPSSTVVPRPAALVRDPTPPAREDAPLIDARRLGEAEAEVADLQLRLKESHTRERRLLETTLELQEALEQSTRTEQELRQQVERYTTYHRAVERSAAWRLIQFLRQLIGRKW
jgi:hypothetical protein